MSSPNPLLNDDYDDGSRQYTCTSLIWEGYKDIGAQKVFGPPHLEEAPTTQEMLAYWQRTNWTTMSIKLRWTPKPGAVNDALLLLAEPGDFLFTYGDTSNSHIAAVVDVLLPKKQIQIAAVYGTTSKVQLGLTNVSANYCSGFYSYLLSPIFAGSQSLGTGR